MLGNLEKPRVDGFGGGGVWKGRYEDIAQVFFGYDQRLKSGFIKKQVIVYKEWVKVKNIYIIIIVAIWWKV